MLQGFQTQILKCVGSFHHSLYKTDTQDMIYDRLELALLRSRHARTGCRAYDMTCPGSKLLTSDAWCRLVVILWNHTCNTIHMQQLRACGLTKEPLEHWCDHDF